MKKIQESSDMGKHKSIVSDDEKDLNKTDDKQNDRFRKIAKNVMEKYHKAFEELAKF